MPFMTGDEFAERYRATVTSPARSSWSSAGLVTPANERPGWGARTVVDKPFHLDLPVSLVDRYA